MRDQIYHCSICGKPLLVGKFSHEMECAKQKQAELDKRFEFEKQKANPTLLPTTGIKPLESFGKGKPRF